MTRSEIFEALKANLYMIVESAQGRDVVESASMKEYGAESLEMVEVVSRTMKQLRIRVPRTELSKASSIGDVLDLFERAGAQPTAARQ
jgi:acyl carrier protein